MKNIIACVDFSDTTPAVVGTALSLATAFRAKLHLLHVMMTVPMLGPIDDAEVLTKCTAEKTRLARETLKSLCQPLRQRGLDVSAILVENARAGEEAILQEARRLDSDLIVIGSHGHGKLYTTILGSTAADVVRKSNCAVVVVPHGVGQERTVEARAQTRVTVGG